MATPPDRGSGKGRPQPPAGGRLPSEIPTPPRGAPGIPAVPPMGTSRPDLPAISTPSPRPPAPQHQRPPPLPPQPPARPAAPQRPPPVLTPGAQRAPAAPAAPARPPPAATARVSPAPVPTPAPRSGAPGPDLDRAQLAELDQRFAQLDHLDYFQLLKLTPQAALADIKSAFYRESRTYHPDRFFHLKDRLFKEKVSAVYRRLTEAYYVLRDDLKRKRYLADIASPERNAKLRFTEAAEAETKQQVKKEQEEQIGVHPKGRHFYGVAMKDVASGNLPSAERNLKTALTFEPSNARYKEKLAEIQQQIHEDAKKQGHSFKIK